MENADRGHNDTIYEGIKDVPRIPELDFENSQGYAEIDAHQRLDPLVQNADVLMVAGAFFGDEAKGKTVDALADCKGIKAVARVNSGENAGHTVFHDGKKFVFHLTPSGIFTGKINLIGPECVMDPVSYMDHEVSQLVNAGVSYLDLLFIGNVQIVTPYHKLLDFLLSPANSSTLKGMSPVHACKVTKRGIRLDHLFGAKETIVSRLKKDLETYYAAVMRLGKSEEQIKADCEAMNADGNTRIPKHVVDFVTAPDKIEYLIELYDRYVVKNPKFPHRKDVTYEIRKFLQAGHKVLLEGPQSYWLSNGAEKFWESSTSADTSAVGLQAAARYNTGKYRHLTINVHKTPASSRVGVGANPSAFVAQDYFSRHGIATLKDFGDKCKDFDTIQKEFWNSIQENGIVRPAVWKEGESEFGLGVAMAVASSLQHGECGATTLKPRVCGLFDCVLHYEVNEAQGPYLTISCFDRGDEYDKVGVVIAYVYYNPNGGETQSNGRVYKNMDFIKAGDPIPTEQVLKYCHPIVKLVDGWKESPIAAGKRQAGDPLPKGVQDLIGTIEHFTGAEVISIGNGRNQQDLIYVQRK